jgi:hypothetical protein
MVTAQMITRASGRAFRFDVRLTWAAVVVVCGVSFGCDKATLLGPIGSSISLSAGSQVVPPGGSTELTAVLLENSGQPVPNGTTVRFTTSLGRIEPIEAQTRNGVATAMFVAGNESGTAEVRALSGLASAPGSNTSTTPTPTPTTPTTPGTGTPTTPTTPTTATPSTSTSAGNVVRILVGAAGAQSITMSSTPSTVSPAGSSVEISAFVNDTNGNRLPGVPVTFSTSRGTVNPTIANTDGNGVARTTLTASEGATVTARVGQQTATLDVRQSAVTSFSLAVDPSSPAAGQPIRLTITPGAVAATPAPGGGTQTPAAPTTGPAPRVTVNWGDGSSEDIGIVAAARSVTHTYAAAGFYTITATGVSPEGETFSTAIPVTVAQQPPVQVTAQPTSGNLATTFSFTITPTTGALIQSVRINYGDGSEDNLGAVSTQTVRQHTYSSVGQKTVTVTQTETNGRITIATVTVTVTN